MIRNREELKKEFYLVCPVRDASSTALAFLENYVDNFEKSHVGVYYPKWDTTQEGDSIWLKICTDNLNGIKNSKYAKAFLSRTSEGSLFDLGMIFFLDKIVEVINPGVIENLKTHTKQFITNYAINYSERRGSKIYDAILERKQKISDAEFLGIYFNGKIRDRVSVKENKTSKTKTFPFSSNVVDALTEYIASLPSNQTVLFGSRKGDKAITRQRAHSILSDAAKAVGIKEQISTHSCRKTMGYQAYMAGIDITRIQSILNHSSPKESLRYIGITRDELDDIYKQLNL